MTKTASPKAAKKIKSAAATPSYEELKESIKTKTAKQEAAEKKRIEGLSTKEQKAEITQKEMDEKTANLARIMKSGKKDK